MSLLLSQGHTQARRYPIAVVWSETRIIRQRESRQRQQEAILVQAAVATAIGQAFGNKDATKAFNDLLKRMDDVG